MGLFSNATIFALMVLPVVLLAKGHHVEFRRLTLLAAVTTACMIAESTLLAFLAEFPPLQHFFAALVVPVMDTLLMSFALNDPKARKVMRVHDAGDDAAAVVATVWTALDLALFRWFRWYHVVSEPGFDSENLVSAAEAFVGLIGRLLTARRINVWNGNNVSDNSGNNNSNNSNNNNNNNGRQHAWIPVVFLRIVMTSIGIAADSPPLGSTLFAAILLLMQYFFPVTHGIRCKED